MRSPKTLISAKTQDTHCPVVQHITKEKSKELYQFCLHCNAALDKPCNLAADAFCCNGCKNAYELCEYAHGDFDLAYYRSDYFLDKHTDALDDSRHRVRWLVSGMHCAACVSRIEALPASINGLQQVRVNLGQSRCDCIYDKNFCNAAEVAEAIQKLGYQVSVYREDKRANSERKYLRNLSLQTAVSALCMMGTMHLGFYGIAGESSQDIDNATKAVLAILQILLTLPVALWAAWPYHQQAVAALRGRYFSLESSISFVVAVAFIASCWNATQHSNELYFDAICMFITFLNVGRLALASAKYRTLSKQQHLHSILPEYAVMDDGKSIVASEHIQPGDRLSLQAEQMLPVDAILISQQASFSTALISGEARTMPKQSGDNLLAGSLCTHDNCIVEATHSFRDSHLYKLINDIETQESPESASLGLSKTLLTWYTPTLLILAIATWLFWANTSLEMAWNQSIAMILACCPCALGLAAPLLQSLILRQGMQRGVLINNLNALFHVHHKAHVVFDKTGTLTTGELHSFTWHFLTHQSKAQQKRIQEIFIAAEEYASHPIARAAEHWAQTSDISPATNINNVKLDQAGIQCESEEGIWKIGSYRYCNCPSPNSEEYSFFICLNNECIAQIDLSDTLRPGIPALMRWSQDYHHHVHCLSGDRLQSTQKIAQNAGIPLENTYGDLLPQDKADKIKILQKQRPVIMIGDGFNDSLALKQADIAIGMRGGIEAASQSCDVLLLEPDAQQLHQVLRAAPRLQNYLRNALNASLAYNVVAVICVLAGFWGPLICAIAMPVSSISIIAYLTTREFFPEKAQLASQQASDDFLTRHSGQIA